MAALMSSPAAEGDVVNIGNDEEVSIDTLAHQVRTDDRGKIRDKVHYIRAGLWARLRRHAVPAP
jgi:nucleoside-diphosphate-sugar epimerase